MTPDRVGLWNFISIARPGVSSPNREYIDKCQNAYHAIIKLCVCGHYIQYPHPGRKIDFAAI